MNFLLEQNDIYIYSLLLNVLLPYEFLLEQNKTKQMILTKLVLLPYEFLLEQNFYSIDVK